MFVSLMAYPEFYKKHMKVFVALAPVVWMDHLDLDLAMAMKNSEIALQNLKD